MMLVSAVRLRGEYVGFIYTIACLKASNDWALFQPHQKYSQDHWPLSGKGRVITDLDVDPSWFNFCLEDLRASYKHEF